MKSICLFCLVSLINLKIATTNENNVCATLEDYYTIKTNNKCWYNVAADGALQDIIELNGYTFEEHEVTTRDGYILTMQRIPNTNHPNPKLNPVFIQHAVLSDASSFVAIGNKSLVELALIDIPTMLNRIREKTDRRHRILYIGHSLGTTVAMMYGSAMPKEAKENVELFLFMGPGYKLSNMISPYRIPFLLFDPIWQFINQHDLERLVSQGSLQRALVKTVCLENPKLLKLCINLMNLFCGPSTEASFDTLLVLSNFLPGGISAKIFHHAADIVRGNFRKYDYGFLNNKIYGQPTPPEYDIKNILVPVYVMYSGNDWATSKDDSTNFYNTLPKQIRHGLYEIESFNHLDFIIARNAKELVYDQILKVFDEIHKKI